MSLYPPPATIKAEVFARMPEHLRKRVRTAWADFNKAGQIADCFLEGPSFDRQGNLWVTDIPHGRVFKISPAGEWIQVAEYDGWPNGLKLHKDGRAFITDYKRGIMILDPAEREGRRRCWKRSGARASRASTISTSPPMATCTSPTRARPACTIRPAASTATRPTASSRASSIRFRARTALCSTCTRTSSLSAVTRANAVWRIPLAIDGGVTKVGVAVQLSGGLAGPDGLALDAEGGLIVAHAGMGCWRFDALLRPTHFIDPPRRTLRHQRRLQGQPALT